MHTTGYANNNSKVIRKVYGRIQYALPHKSQNVCFVHIRSIDVVFKIAKSQLQGILLSRRYIY